MSKKSFYEILLSGEYTPNALRKLPFRMDSTGPLYEVILLSKNKNYIDTINKNNFKLKVGNIEITDKKVKLSVLLKLVYNHKTI
jgi:hypothetical protein